MLGQIISRNRLKVTIGRLRLNGVRIRLEECVLHWFCKLEILECLPISRRIVSSISGIMCGKFHGLATALDSDSLGFEFLIFIVREGLSIARICFEGHRVDWVLGFLLVEAVFIAIFPIGETILVTA